MKSEQALREEEERIRQEEQRAFYARQGEVDRLVAMGVRGDVVVSLIEPSAKVQT